MNVNGTSALQGQREIIHIEATVPKELLKVRVAGYARVSSDSEDQLNSFATQVNYYTELIQKNEKWEMVDIYADEGISGVSTEKRADFNRMMQDCRDGKIDRIITKSTSRFARNVLDALEATRELKLLGVSVYFEKESIDTAKLSGENLLTLYSLFAQEESLAISRNCKKGAQMRMKNGSFVPGHVPYGYRLQDKEMVIYEPEAEIVRRIFKEYLMGNGSKKIATMLNAQGVAGKSDNKKWTNKGVRIVLKNEKYKGDMLLQKTFREDIMPYRQHSNRGEVTKYYVKDTHPPIISCVEFELVNVLLRERAKKVNLEYGQYMLSKTIYCKECGSSYRRKAIEDDVFWVCRKHDLDKEDCASQRIEEQAIYHAFLAMYHKLRHHTQEILKPMLTSLYKLQESEQRGNSDIKQINRKIADLTEQNHTMAGLLSRGILDSALFIAQSDELKKQLQQAKQEKRRVLEKLQQDDCIETTQTLIEILEGSPETLEQMDEQLFKKLVQKILAREDESIDFVLINGLVLTERL